MRRRLLSSIIFACAIVSLSPHLSAQELSDIELDAPEAAPAAAAPAEPVPAPVTESAPVTETEAPPATPEPAPALVVPAAPKVGETSPAILEAPVAEPVVESPLGPQTAPSPGDPEAPPPDRIVEDPNDAKFEDEPGGSPAQVKDSKALNESGLSNPGGHAEFKRPLLFAPEDNGLKLEFPQIKWEMEDGTRINMGGLRISESQIRMIINQTPRDDTSNDFRRSSSGPALVNNVSFMWPELMSTTGTLTIETGDRRIRWRQEITEKKREEWARLLKKRENNELATHAKSQWGLLDFSGGLLAVFKKGGNFRMCLTKRSTKRESMRACSTYTQVRFEGEKIIGTELRPKTEANVYLVNQALGRRGLLHFPPGKPVRLRVSFSSGARVEIASLPVKLSLLDVVESKDGREVILTGRNTEPLGKRKIISKPETHFWSITGIDQDTIWQIAISKEAPTVRVLGTFNLPFTFVFNFDRLPKESDRVYIREQASTGAYSDTPLLYGYSANGARISSKETFARNTDPQRFEWTFMSKRKGERNRARLFVKNRKEDGRPWVAHHMLFRGFSYEASARVTGVATVTNQLAFLGEMALNGWFESLGFTQNDIISRQRWGVAGRYFRSLASVSTAPGSPRLEDFAALNLDGKYNLYRGVWNRDELFGMIGSVQQVTLKAVGLTETQSYNSMMMGGGFYWARTMPKIFADLFDFVPYLDYSKYVDVELIFYPISLTPGYLSGTTSNLNFHGKVFWTKRLYGEMGFGVRRYDISNKTAALEKDHRKAALNVGYGNIGLGYAF